MMSELSKETLSDLNSSFNEVQEQSTLNISTPVIKDNNNKTMESSKNTTTTTTTVDTVERDVQNNKLSRTKFTSNKNKKNNPFSKSKVDRPKSPILPKDVVTSSRNMERKKSAGSSSINNTLNNLERKKSIGSSSSMNSPLNNNNNSMERKKSIGSSSSMNSPLNNNNNNNLERKKSIGSSSMNSSLNNNNLERRKSIGSSTNRNRNIQSSTSTTSTRKSKNGITLNNDDSGPADNLLNRRKPSAPPKLNLTFKNNRSISQQISPMKDSSSKNSPSNKISPSVTTAPPLISPKIIELRKSESFQSKSSTKEDSTDDDSLNVTSPKKETNSKPPLFVSNKSHRGATAIKKSSTLNEELLARLEQQNSQLQTQGTTGFLLARLERQNEMLDNDPKSVCIESNILKANFEVVQSLIDDITNPEVDSKKLVDSDDDETKKIDWDFWTALIQDYTAVATKLPHLLEAKLQQGLPSKLRGLIWQSMSQASSTYLETMYSQLLSESSPYDKIIERDLSRTFPSVEMFKEENGSGQTMLWNVLKAYSLYDPLVGYCQGLGFLVGPLLMNMSESQAFCVFVRLMETYDIRTMFTLNMEGLQLRLYQFSCLLSQILPNLHTHLHHLGIQAAMYASQWFLSLFAYTYPLPLVFRIYDVVFAEGAPETIMRVAIALLKKNEEKLLEFEEFEDSLDFLTSKLYEAYDNTPTGLIKDAMELSSIITKSKLDQLSEAYVQDLEDQKKRAEELVAVRFNDRFGRSKKDKKKDDSRKSKRWSFKASLQGSKRHSIAAMQELNYSTSVTSSDASASSDNETIEVSTQVTPPPSSPTNGDNVGKLHKQIEDLATALSLSQKENADVTDQLVKIKMEKLDLVNEMEEMKNRLKGLEKENKRMSTQSIISIDSSMTLNNDEEFESGRSTRIASPITPNGYDHVKQYYGRPKLDFPEKEILKTRRLSAPASSITDDQLSLILNRKNDDDDDDVTFSKDKKFGLVKEWNEKSKEQYSLELALTEELIQVKQEKFELMLENKELVKRNGELENALENSHQIQKSIQDKNKFLSNEIGRLDEEAAQALYEHNSMKEEIKSVKSLRIEHARSNKENEKLKKELENVEQKLRQYEPEYVRNDDWVTAMEEVDEIVASTLPKSTRRVSFLSFFGTSKSGGDGDCTGENCVSSKKCDELEKMLKHVKMLLVESETARDQMSSQLEDLNHMLNGFGSFCDGEIDDILQSVEENSSQQKPKSEKRLSIAAFFGAS